MDFSFVVWGLVGGIVLSCGLRGVGQYVGGMLRSVERVLHSGVSGCLLAS